MLGLVASSLFLALLGIVFLGPLAGLFAQIQPIAFQELLAAPSFLKSLKVTLISGAGAAAVSVFVGILFARQFALFEWRAKRLQRLLLLIPYLVPNFILATAYVISWNPGTGLLNRWMEFPGGLYGLVGMTLLFSITHMPVAFLMFEDKFRRMDSSWREAATLSGAKGAEILFKIELPVLKPTLISAFMLCFALNISAFAIPAWIGAPERVYPLTYKIYQAIQVGGSDGIPIAAGYSVVLFLLSLPLLLIGSWTSRNERKYALLSGKAARAGDSRQSGGRMAMFQGLFWVSQCVFWIAPLLTLLSSTLVKPGCLQSQGASCFSDLTLRSYHYVLFELSEARAGFHGSLIYGGLSAVLIMCVCAFSLLLFSKQRSQMRLAEWIFAIPVATPGAIIALGLIVTLSGRFGVNLYNTPYIVMVAFMLKHFNLAFLPMRTGLTNISPSLFEAGRLSGASTSQIWGRIVLPILRPELLGAFFLVLIPILGELTMSIFLASPSFRSIGTVLFDLQDYADQSSAAAMSVLLVILILAANEVARVLSRGKLGF